MSKGREEVAIPQWAFITNYGAVLAFIAQHSQVTAREMAAALGITERSVRRIIRDLEGSGYVQKRLVGRVNGYQVNQTMPLPGARSRSAVVGDLLRVLVSEGTASGCQ